MAPVLDVQPGMVHQLEVDLVHEAGGAERLFRASAADLRAGEGAELVVDEREQLCRGARISFAPGDEEPGDVAGGGGSAFVHGGEGRRLPF